MITPALQLKVAYWYSNGTACQELLHITANKHLFTSLPQIFGQPAVHKTVVRSTQRERRKDHTRRARRFGQHLARGTRGVPE